MVFSRWFSKHVSKHLLLVVVWMYYSRQSLQSDHSSCIVVDVANFSTAFYYFVICDFTMVNFFSHLINFIPILCGVGALCLRLSLALIRMAIYVWVIGVLFFMLPWFFWGVFCCFFYEYLQLTCWMCRLQSLCWWLFLYSMNLNPVFWWNWFYHAFCFLICNSVFAFYY